ncbi:ferritin-like domain-containing protein [Oleiagrimonas sp.]|uniref:ferritin-like domain-containing protein n=1 Tax=Oleiagrimonas sp. TaxID=2010330 RepID=UPI002614B2C8|nr:ferritin-like domain-containing protein [Oleiagrimonas sp.]MDA3912688.1 ferritin-like domain-containing protein [Oleiagrimonas sp.]
MPDVLARARACIDCCDPEDKLRQTHATWRALQAGELAVDAEALPPPPIGDPGRPLRPRLVAPRALPQRGLGTPEGRVALVHAVAHIEFNAINLAWDAVYRFRGMPAAYYTDWARVADDEARHFALLAGRLCELGHAYGDFDAHNGLWDMAQKTAHSDVARMALVPRVLEARGLDVTPGMIERLKTAGDMDTVAILEVILREEVAHVHCGSHWFRWCCARDGLEPRATFRKLLSDYMRGGPKGPFNLSARRAAGFDEDELSDLQASTQAPVNGDRYCR